MGAAGRVSRVMFQYRSIFDESVSTMWIHQSSSKKERSYLNRLFFSGKVHIGLQSYLEPDHWTTFRYLKMQMEIYTGTRD